MRDRDVKLTIDVGTSACIACANRNKSGIMNRGISRGPLKWTVLKTQNIIYIRMQRVHDV